MSNKSSEVLGAVISAIDVVLSISMHLQQIGAMIQKAQDEGRDLSDDEVNEIARDKVAAFARLKAAVDA